jgi:hypothetical protein
MPASQLCICSKGKRQRDPPLVEPQSRAAGRPFGLARLTCPWRGDANAGNSQSGAPDGPHGCLQGSYESSAEPGAQMNPAQEDRQRLMHGFPGVQG